MSETLINTNVLTELWHAYGLYQAIAWVYQGFTPSFRKTRSI